MNEAQTIEIYTDDGPLDITITPILETVGNVSYFTGIYKLHEGPVGLGEIVIDTDTANWEYTGIGDLTYEQQQSIVSFINEQTRKGR